MIRVFVVDDSAFVRSALRRALAAEPGLAVVGEAASGHEALDRIPPAHPDVVTLDVGMPDLDGLAVLRALLRWQPTLRVLMLSAHTREGADATLEALTIGAVDFIDKSRFGVLDVEAIGRELVARIKTVAEGPRGGGTGGQRGSEQRGGEAGAPRRPFAAVSGGPRCLGAHGLAASRPRSPASNALLPRSLASLDLCIIGASTGGPAAIQQLLEGLPADFPLPIAIVQHMPPGFTRPFAARLDARCKLRVSEAVDGDRLVPGRVVIAPAGMHLRVSANLAAVLSPEPASLPHVPSVDVLMRSAARARPGRVLGILLTGMGSDGADGMATIRAGGGITIAESAETCVVYGMPRAALQRGGVSSVLPLPAIAAWLAGLRAGSRGAASAPR